MKEVFINGIAFPFDHIIGEKKSGFENDAFTAAICSFIRDWQSGKENFTLATSGSTGEPSLITVSRSQMVASARNTIGFFNLLPGDRILMCMNPSFIAGKMMIVRAMVGDLSLYAVTPTSNPLAGLEQDSRFAFIAVTPHQLHESLVRSPEKTAILNNMKAIIVGGGPVSAALKSLAEALEVPVYSTYGMTETVSHVALQRINGRGQQDYFEAIGDARFETDDSGRLIITASVTDGKALITNDRVQLLSETRFIWLGRVDHVVNSGGIKISVEEVEKKIERAIWEKGLHFRFFIFGVPDPALGEKVCLAVEHAPIDEEKIASLIQQVLAKYERPKKIFNLPQFIETPTGKIDRKKTIAIFPST